jgi:hypothetical protein
MYLVMAANKNSDDYKSRYLNMLEDKVTAIGINLDRNTQTTEKILEQTKETNGRVLDLEERSKSYERAIKKLENKKGRELPISDTVLKWTALSLLVALLILAANAGIDLSSLRSIL